jgi:hypothetical protein
VNCAVLKNLKKRLSANLESQNPFFSIPIFPTHVWQFLGVPHFETHPYRVKGMGQILLGISWLLNPGCSAFSRGVCIFDGKIIIFHNFDA